LGSNPQNYVPFPDFARGSSYADTIGVANYHSLQTKYQRRFSNGLTMLFAYTYAKTLTDAGDLLSGGGVGGYRAPYLPGWGIKKDMGLAPFDIRHAVSFSGSYDLPFGKGQRFMAGSNRISEFVLGNWSTNWILKRSTVLHQRALEPAAMRCTPEWTLTADRTMFRSSTIPPHSQRRPRCNRWGRPTTVRSGVGIRRSRVLHCDASISHYSRLSR
jgi:hypothetical protein